MSDQAAQPLRKLAVDLGELAIAFETDRAVLEYFFDLETGETIMITEETRSLLEEMYELAAEEDPDAEPDLPALIAREGIHDWQAEMLLDADRVKRGHGGRYVHVPRRHSREGFRDMEEFVGTVDDERLRNRLDRALGGRGSFRRFQDVLYDHEPERQRWFAFKNRRDEQRVVEWLESLGIEPIVEQDVP